MIRFIGMFNVGVSGLVEQGLILPCPDSDWRQED
jgi:hypothetical protein